MSEKRIAQLNELIKHELGILLVREIEFPRDMFTTITRVEVSVDLRYAAVYIGVIPEQKRGTALEIMRKARHHIQHLLNKRLSMRSIPQLRYKIDTGAEEEIDDVEKLLDAVKKEL